MRSEQAGRPGKKPATTPVLEADQERVGATVRTIRELRGFTPQQFATAIGISRPHLVKIELGQKKLTNVLLAKAAGELGVAQIAIMRPLPSEDGTR
ncbi:helix-turn-helix domain-containing protein [Nocardia sp. NPDC059240]|uniref:helix-turn-helix domain-containing protein n=1 Tax=Nocardia sp. NPDC059240 TaxID=3346786 RepID=UPI0036C12FC6